MTIRRPALFGLMAPVLRPLSRRDGLRQMMRAVAESHELTEADLLVRDRSRPVAQVRHLAWYRCAECGFGVPEIAALGGWDVSAVHYGIERASATLAAAKRGQAA